MHKNRHLHPEGGQARTYLYDTLNRLTGINVGTAGYTYGYNGANPLLQDLTRPNGSKTTYTYDNLNRLTQIANLDSTAQALNRFSFTYNADDLIGNETVENADPVTGLANGMTTYNYNNLNQLLSTTSPDQLFHYDPDGNMTRGVTPEGHMFTATYDANDRMTAIEYTDTANTVHKAEFTYDYGGFMAKLKTYENGNITADINIVRNGYLAIQERDTANTTTREYTWGLNMGGGIGGLLALRQNNQDYNYLYDGKGNVSALIDNAQTVVAKYRYDAFGNIMAKAGTVDQPYMFSTKRYFEGVGLSYYGYRFYSAGVGRWVNRDPLGEMGGVNLYGFVGGDPVNWIDSYGLAMAPTTYSYADDPAIEYLLNRDFYNKQSQQLALNLTMMLSAFFPISPAGFGSGFTNCSGSFRSLGKFNLRKLGLENINLSHKSYNAGRKLLEKAKFIIVRITDTGRRVFRNPKTGAEVWYDSGNALATGQKPHWHIVDKAGIKYSRTGRKVPSSSGASHIPAQ